MSKLANIYSKLKNSSNMLISKKIIYTPLQLITEKRLKLFLLKRPLFIKVETTNTCNSRCVFCGYLKMKRKRQIMSLELFEKVVNEYDRLGGGAIKLTPCVGELLLDPYLVERFSIISKYQNLKKVSFTTNLIAHDILSDKDWINILQKTYFLQISIGGFEQEPYKQIYGVDKFNQVLTGINRLISLKKRSKSNTNLAISFRTTDRNYLESIKNNLSKYRNENIYYSNVASFGNWGGVLNKENTSPHISLKAPFPKNSKIPCVVMYSSLGILSSGEVTACPCCDMDGSFFPLGNVREANISELYRNASRQKLLTKMPEVCMKCTMYCSFQILSRSKYINLRDPKNLSLSYYQEITGG